MELAAERGHRATRLQVDGAFHSPLMEPAAERLRPALDRLGPRPARPALPVDHHLRASSRRRGCARCCSPSSPSPVRFGDAVAAALDAGAERFVEVGHGRVLSALVKRVRRDAAVAQVGEPDDVEALVA